MASEDMQGDAPDTEQTATATVTAPVKKPAPPKRTFDHVIKSIMRLTTLEAEEAVLKTLEAHETGVALLLVTHQERAELYVEQFASLSVTVTMEPACG